MAKVLNKTSRSLPVERWTLLAGGTKCVDRYGKVREELPDSVAYGPVVKHLLSLDLVSMGSAPKRTVTAVPVSGLVQEIDLDAPTKKMDGRQRGKLRGEKRS
jgi:hypothetical protein